MHRHVQIVFFGIVTAGVISLTEAHPLIFDHPPIPLAEIGSTPASGYIEPIAARSNTPKFSGRGKESRPKDVSRPNILFLFADDQRNHTLGCAGHPIVQSPNIDRLASEGVRFENAFVTTSTCWVSRACLFTGCYERKHLYRVTPGPLKPELCRTSHFSVLKEAGYRTGHLGKEHV
ncbi:MAG: sulfatase-like hydrolase/transferase, partial [Planctomycetota bacterium]|nr:sulfatase-like hydrolase/transferase [Planctomycetota bacterium]